MSMYLKTGNTIFGNKGLIISLFLLIVLVYFSYNKCYKNYENDNNDVNKFENIEHFLCTIGTEADCKNLPKPDDVRVLITKGGISLNFTLDNKNDMRKPSNFIVVLAQYDNNKKNTGNNKFYLSNEYTINATVVSDSSNYQTNICNIVNNDTKCLYKFTNLDIRDSTGKLFFYKIGISAIYNNYNTPFVMPYNVNTIDKLFTIDSSTEEQNQEYTDFLKYQETLNINKLDLSNTMSTADGNYELIKSQLGNYPDNLLLDDLQISKTSLNDLVDKTMADGIININVKMATPTDPNLPNATNANNANMPNTTIPTLDDLDL